MASDILNTSDKIDLSETIKKIQDHSAELYRLIQIAKKIMKDSGQDRNSYAYFSMCSLCTPLLKMMETLH